MKVDGAPAGPSRRTGRPLSFDRNEALRQAMLAFWRHGYETTSIADLTSAMGITPPSLYGAFGDKKRLFLEVVDAYVGDQSLLDDMLEQAPSSLEAARDMLTAAVTGYTGKETPPGCLLASATASGSSASADVQAAVAAIRSSVIDCLRKRVERDKIAGLLPSDVDAETLARLTMTIMQGLSVMARDGLSRSALRSIAEASLEAWPKAASV